MENWKDVIGYECIYQISNLGRVKSLSRSIIRSNGKIQTFKERILKSGIDTAGYYIVKLYKKDCKRTIKVHQIVAQSFLNHIICGMDLVVNHKDFNKLNNNVENLEIVTQRENANKKHIKSSSIYMGVSYHKASNKWSSYININGRKKYLGLYKCELSAYYSKLKALNTVNNKI